MIVKRKKPEDGASLVVDLVNTEGNTDYIKDGEIVKNAPNKVVLVTAESDLDGIADSYETGTIAYTAGFKNIWQLSAGGEWVEV